MTKTMTADKEHAQAVVENMRALRGQLEKGGRGKQSFYPLVDLSKNPGRACSWERHFKYGTCARELIGYLESLEEKFPRPNRFVFAEMETLRMQCFDGPRAESKNFSRRMFWETVKLLRGLGILSPVVQRDGHQGLIVAPHNALCTRSGNQCEFVGFTSKTVLQKQRAALGLEGRFAYRMSAEECRLIWHPDAEEK